MNGLKFHPDIIKNCPPSDASPGSGLIYRMVKSFPPASDDFDSDVERKTKNCDQTNCDCWGCSVWADSDGVETAMNLFKYWRKRYIVSVSLKSSDGLTKNSPSNGQPGHYTFWKAVGVDLSNKCTIFRSPDEK
jgi:hypothetical protein